MLVERIREPRSTKYQSVSNSVRIVQVNFSHKACEEIRTSVDQAKQPQIAVPFLVKAEFARPVLVGATHGDLVPSSMYVYISTW
jgi:hypothetical protein